MMTKQDMVMQNDTYSLLTIISSVLVFSGWLLVGVLAALVMIALTPPNTKTELLGMVASAFASSLHYRHHLCNSLRNQGFTLTQNSLFLKSALIFRKW